MTDHDKLLARMDTWLGTGDSDTADFLQDMRDAAAAIRGLTAGLATVEAETIRRCINECNKLAANKGDLADKCSDALIALNQPQRRRTS